MEQYIEQIMSYISNNGLPVFIIASCIIFLIGFLKFCKVFDKITNKDVKKFIYYALNIVLSFAGAAIYFGIFKLNFVSYLPFAASQVTAVTTLYAIYENLGMRKLVQIGLAAIAKLFTKHSEHKFVKEAKKLGLDVAIKQLQDLVAEEAKQTNATGNTTK